MQASMLAKKQYNRQSSKELIPIHDTNPFKPILPRGSLTLTPGTSAQAGSTEQFYTALAAKRG